MSQRLIGWVHFFLNSHWPAGLQLGMGGGDWPAANPSSLLLPAPAPAHAFSKKDATAIFMKIFYLALRSP